MSFLFGKKKPGAREGNPPGASSTPTPTLNGVKERDNKPGGAQNITPGSSVNNSLNSLGGATTPSPDHGSLSRTSHEQDSQISSARPAVNGHTPTNSGPSNANLYPWSKRRLTFTTSQPNPFPRYGAAVNSISSKEGDVYVMGGLVNGTTVKGDLWMIEAGAGNLACYPIGTKSEGPGPRVGHASLLVGNAFIVFGGDTKQDETDPLDDTLYLLNTSTRQWSRAIPPGLKPAGRYGHTLNILGSKIYVFGGQVDGHFFNDLIAFDLNALQDTNNRWELLIQDTSEGDHPQEQVPLGRTNHTVVTWNDKLYLFGGTDGIQWFNDVWTYDPRLNSWCQLDCIGFIPQPREGHSAALVNDVMYIFGGRTQDGNDLGDLAAFRITSRRWYTFQNMGPSPSPRSGHSMTAYGQQIVVLAGEPSSAPRDPSELSLVYVLDTAKIRYPNDQQIQQTPSGERVPGNRRPSQDKSGIPQSKGTFSPETPIGPPDGPKRILGGQKEIVPNGPAAANGLSANGTNSRLPRASASGPPPQQQAPPPRTNGILPVVADPRSRTPTRDVKGFGSSLDTSRATSFDRPDRSPNVQEDQRALQNRAMSPVTNISANGRPTPTKPPSRLGHTAIEPEEMQPTSTEYIGSLDRQGPQQSLQRNNASQPSLLEQPRPYMSQIEGMDNTSKVNGETQRTDTATTAKIQSLTNELEVAKSQNDWYASELALAKQAGYTQNALHSSKLDERALQTIGENEKPLIEALITMKAELAQVQSAVGSRVQEAAQMIAVAEQQRDAAIKEAVFAKAKLAAHGGSQAGTPQLDDSSRDVTDSDRSDLSRRLGSALVLQTELQSRLDSVTAELQSEKRARESLEESMDVAVRRGTELEKAHDPGKIEGLRAELDEAQRELREEKARRMDADARARLLEVDLQDLRRELAETSAESENNVTMLTSLRDAVTASQAKSAYLERKLDEERAQQESIQRKLLQLRAEHEERTSELESTTRRLRDAEELADKNASEAQSHRSAVMSGLDKLTTKTADVSTRATDDERVAILQQQVQEANTLIKKNQVDADNATAKLRKAEERVAGLEKCQEQISRDSLSARKQLQEALRAAQSFQAQHSELKRSLESHQRDASAMSVQHNALKELLDERPQTASGQNRARNLSSPGDRLGSPDVTQLRELEQKLEESQRCHEETKSTFESREVASEKQYRDKLEQLEQDYQSAVTYVRATESVMQRMKDELNKSKTVNARLQAELDKHAGNQTMDSEVPADWESERQSLRQEIKEMQESVKGSVFQLEQQMEEVKTELRVAQEERDHYRTSNEQAQEQLSQTTRQAQARLDQLKSENVRLETRAADAENKVSLLLDQVESSVDTYRRQSQQLHVNGVNHTRNTSTNSMINHGGHSHSSSIGADSAFNTSGPGERNSLALDSLASELETLRTQWEGTHRTYRLSSQFDFERSAPTGSGAELSDSLANWRRRLDAEEAEKDNSRSPADGPSGGFRTASARGGRVTDKERGRGGMPRERGEEGLMNVI